MGTQNSEDVELDSFLLPCIERRRYKKKVKEGIPEGMKECSTCKIIKPFEDFYADKRRRDGCYPNCKKCATASTRGWMERNPDAAKATHENWCNKYGSIRKKENHQEHKKEYRVHYTAQENARRAMKLKAMPKWADPAEIEKKYEEARLLTELLGEPFEVDHIVPLKSNLVCGLHWEGNLQVIPASINASKNNRYWPDMP